MSKLLKFTLLLAILFAIYVYPTGLLLVIMYMYTRHQSEILANRLKAAEEALNETRGIVAKMKRKQDKDERDSL